jgi:phospholipid/cholesterol/gamma-HCH transport system substrate-binding protein
MAAKVTQGVKVAIFVILSAGAGYAIYRVASKQVGTSGGYVVHSYIGNATGLAAHSRVTIAGIPVGSIDKISLENGRARIDVKVTNDIALHKNATLGKKAASLLGESIIVLTPGTDDQPRVKDGDEIMAMPDETTTGEILDEVKVIADRIKDVADQLAKSIGTEQGGQNIRAILQNLADATDALNGTIRENREVIKETLKNVQQITANANPELRAILENVRVVTENVRELLAQNQAGAPPGELRDTLDHVNKASKSLESALAHIDSIAGRADRGEGTIGRLSKDETLINEVQGVAEGVNDYVGSLSRLQTIVGLREDYLFLANSIKSYVELRLQPREDKYYMIELINDPRGKTSFEQQDVDTTNPNNPPHYTTVTTTTTNAFRFSLMFARRLGPFTGRFGIKESTGGIGLDIHLLQNRFEVVQDLFGFGEEIQPRYRIYVAYEFVKKLWLLGGVDHLFLADRRDYFLGLQLRFTDDDLKTILPFSGGAGSLSR